MKNSVLLDERIILCCLMWLYLTYFGYSVLFLSYIKVLFFFLFSMIGWIGRLALLGLKWKNLCHSKMVICIENVLSLDGANFQYKFSDYPKGFWNSASYLNILAKTKIYEPAHIWFGKKLKMREITVMSTGLIVYNWL